MRTATCNETPTVSVIIVSDYELDPATKSWRDASVALDAIAAQDFSGPVELIVVESKRFRDHVPAELRSRLPGARWHFIEASGSSALINEGIRLAGAPLVAHLDADVAPAPDWLRTLTGVLRARPEVAIAIAKTVYPGTGLLQRCLQLLDRSYIHPGASGLTPDVGTDNYVARREALLASPISDGAPFLQMDAIQHELQRAGQRIYFADGTRVLHAFGGWRFERDLGRNRGFCTIRRRQNDRSLPLGRWVRLGYASIPLYLAVHTIRQWRLALLRHRHYAVRWYEVPVACALSVALLEAELLGMIDAFRQRDFVPGSAFR